MSTPPIIIVSSELLLELNHNLITKQTRKTLHRTMNFPEPHSAIPQTISLELKKKTKSTVLHFYPLNYGGGQTTCNYKV